MDVELRLTDWFAAERRVAGEAPERRRLLEDLVDLVVAELRRRVGRPFTLDELARDYDGGTSWAVDLLTRRAPSDPWAWDPGLAVDAAYARYARHGRDVGGGRRVGGRRRGED